MSRCSLWYLFIRAGLDCVDEVGEEDCILNKKYRDVISDNIYALEDEISNQGTEKKTESLERCS